MVSSSRSPLSPVGIGAVIAARLALDGFAVVVNYASRAAEADDIVAKLLADGRKAIAIKADVSKSEEARALFEAAEEAFGKVDVLVNNASILHTKPLGETDDATFEKIFAVNVRGTFNTLREAASRLNDGGHIVNFSSTTLALNMPGYAIYGP